MRAGVVCMVPDSTLQMAASTLRLLSVKDLAVYCVPCRVQAQKVRVVRQSARKRDDTVSSRVVHAHGKPIGPRWMISMMSEGNIIGIFT